MKAKFTLLYGQIRFEVNVHIIFSKKKILRGRSLEGRGSYPYRYLIGVFFQPMKREKSLSLPPRGGGRNFKKIVIRPFIYFHILLYICYHDMLC